MAALSEQPAVPLPAPLIDLRDVQPGFLDSLLTQETAEWMADLDWDFEPSANLVRRFIGMHGLTGFALPAPRQLRDLKAAGYAYYVADEGKGLIGGLYVTPALRSPAYENALLSAVLDALWQMPGLHRIEAQLMMLSNPMDRAVPYAAHFRPYARHFLEASLAEIVALPPRDPTLVITPWTENRRADASRLVSQAYTGHIDSQINDQYRSPAGARRFLTNIVEYPGCGAFFTPASFVALAGGGQGLAGMSLASQVAPAIPTHRTGV
jgi:hypothetical protein